MPAGCRSRLGDDSEKAHRERRQDPVARTASSSTDAGWRHERWTDGPPENHSRRRMSQVADFSVNLPRRLLRGVDAPIVPAPGGYVDVDVNVQTTSG